MNDIPSEKRLPQGMPSGESGFPSSVWSQIPLHSEFWLSLFLPIDCSLLEEKECILILS